MDLPTRPTPPGSTLGSRLLRVCTEYASSARLASPDLYGTERAASDHGLLIRGHRGRTAARIEGRTPTRRTTMPCIHSQDSVLTDRAITAAPSMP